MQTTYNSLLLEQNGIPHVMVARGGTCKIGENFVMHNNLKAIGRREKCLFFVNKNAELVIEKNVGISSTAIVAHKSITIKENVKIGGNVCIYDTYFHSLDAKTRSGEDDATQKACKEVVIEKNAFIGAHSTILKGVHIGENAIIGACSVVTKNIPANEIWAGNPAKFLKKAID
jgi:acetyltransferase-like isoleucine patch superfamily enzyme